MIKSGGKQMKATAKKNANHKKTNAPAKLEELVKKLPRDKQQEVLDFAQALLAKKSKRKSRKLRLDWFGGLKEIRDQYTSLELQKKALDWRIEHAARRH
jgi:hypothetical protein